MVTDHVAFSVVLPKMMPSIFKVTLLSMGRMTLVYILYVESVRESSSSYHPKQVEGLPPKKTLQQVESSIEGADLVEDDQRENQLPVLQTLCHHLSSSSASIFGKEARGEGGGVQGDDNQASIQGFPCHDKSPG